ncbi:MAG: hypothetical protein MUF48_10285 [Pirellulaceae bacterium]|nr:hypothetical protein [Pirellulaceae bacterium]
MTRVLAPLCLSLLLLVVPSARGAEPAQAVVSRDGAVRLARGHTTLLELRAGLFDSQWRGAEAGHDAQPSVDPPAHALRLATPARQAIRGLVTIVQAGQRLQATYVFTPQEDVVLNSLHVASDFPIAALAGGRWQADAQSGTFPAEFGAISLFSGAVRTLKLTLASGEALTFDFPQPTHILLQDNRQWGPSFVLRISTSSTPQAPFRKDQSVTLGFTLAAAGGIKVEHDAPVTIAAGNDWIPLKLQLDIDAGSALDFAHLWPHAAPAGHYGWLQAHSDGTFRFEKQPDQPVRFYGVNLCFSAHYLTHERSDQLAERFRRLGYNTVRFHHYEGELTQESPDRTRLDPQKLDQLDYLFAALTKRGIYVTTDLFVSRPVNIAALLPNFPAGRRDQMNAFKVLATNHPGAYENWKTFTRNLLTHVNPYTGRAYTDDPGLAWLSLINEGNLGNYINLIREVPEFQRGWNDWLLTRYRDRAGLAAAWGAVLQDNEDPAKGTVRLEGNIYDQDLRARDLICYLTGVDHDFFVRAARFLREELGVRALLTNLNAWTNHAVTQQVRAEMDYVDDHFYVDHPEFLEQSWRLPSRCSNTSPVAGGATGGRHITFTRLFDRPFTLSEYNYSGPGRYRGVGGILTGAMGALQDWGAIWRFAYSHNRDDLFEPGRMDYFNMASDPLSQAAERASLCLFLRGDLQPAPHSVALVMTPDDWRQLPPKLPNLAAPWHWAAWITRVGTRVVPDPAAALPHDVVLPLGWGTPAAAYAAGPIADVGAPYAASRDQIDALLRERGLIAAGNPTDPRRQIYQSETGEITIDAPRDVLTLDTPRTAGGFAPEGETIRTRHGLTAAISGAPATVWVSALDDEPIARSGRLLLTHLTDLQNTEIEYAERARQTLLAWGRLPHLVRAGQVEVRLRVAEPQGLQVWALSTSGARVAQVPTRVENAELIFTGDVASVPSHGAVLCYEIARAQR